MPYERKSFLTAPALLAVVLFVPLFVFRSFGPIDFWWWMSANIAVLVLLSFAGERAYLPSVLSDIQSRPSWKIGMGVITALLLYGVFLLGNLLSREIFPDAGTDISHIYGFKEGASALRIALLMVFLIGPGEELFWRGYLQRNFQSRFGGTAGWLLTGTLYALVHAGSGNLMLVLAAAICGFFWGYIYFRLKSVFLVAVSHTIWDLLVFIIFPLVAV